MFAIGAKHRFFGDENKVILILGIEEMGKEDFDYEFIRSTLYIEAIEAFLRIRR